MNQIEKKIEVCKERQFKYVKLALFSFFVFLFSINIHAQDSILEKEDIAEESELKFQQFFFKALSEKSIGNYQKAIENLESCNQIISNDIAVFFEFSKNYLSLNNTLLAREYVQRALVKEPANIWMLTHLVQIYIKDRNFEKAIDTQKKLVAIDSKKREFLVRLYVSNGLMKEAILLMNTLDQEKSLPASLKRLRTTLESRNKYTTKNKDVEVDLNEEESEEERNTGEQEVLSNDIHGLKQQFKTDKSYKILEDILKKSTGNNQDLLQFSEEGIALFPAQPFVYLMHGKVLNDTKNHKKALSILKDGIDFVIDNEMEAAFYLEMAKAYKNLGDTKEEIKYLQKAKNLKN